MWRLLAALAAGTAPPADPEGLFDRLFGSEPERAESSADGRAGRDDLTLVGLALGTAKLRDDVAAWKTPEGLCLPIDAVLDALEISHERAPDGAETVRLFAPTRTRVIPAQEMADSPGGRCLTIARWARALPASFRYDEINLRVVIDAAEPLPAAVRVEREERRRAELRPAPGARAPLPMAENPWRWFAPPTLDLALSGEMSRRGPAARLTIEASGDLLKSSARTRFSIDTAGQVDARLTLARTGAPGELPFGISAIEVGDIAAPAQPLLAEATTGRGLALTTRPAWRADLFDQIELRGPLPPGWEAELHREDQLIAVVREADRAGDWVFADVPLRTGYNRYVVRLYGPHGETDAREFVRVVGSELNPENETHWTLGLVQPGRPLFGAAETPGAKAAAFAGVERGLTPSLTARLDVRVPLAGGRPALSAGLHAGLLGGFGSLLVASDGHGRPPVALRASRRLGATELRLDLAEFGDAPGETAPAQQREFARMAGLSALTRIPFGRRSMPVQLSLSRAEIRSGGAVTRLDSQVALALGPARLSNRLGVEWRAGQSNARGAFSAAVPLGVWRLRAGVDYRLASSIGADRVQLSASRATPTANLSLDLGWDLRRRRPLAAIGAGRSLGPFAIGGFAGLGADGWRAGLSLGFSLFRPGHSGYRAGPPGLSRTAALRPLLFVDEDGDGLLGSADQPVRGGGFLVDASIRPEKTDATGTGLLAGIAPYRPVEIEPQLASLPDLSLRPVEAGARARLRPGQVLDVPLALRLTGEIEARVLLRNGDVQKPLPGMEVLLEQHGKTIARTVADFDGYAYFSGIPFGRWLLRVQARPATTAEVQIARDAPAATDVRLWVPAGS